MIRRVHTSSPLVRILPKVAFITAWMGCQADAPTVPPPPPPSIEERHRTVAAELDALIRALTDDGRYACCTKAPCKWCALRTAGCACGPGLKKGEPVCEECALMWTKGLGDVEGVDPEGVRSFLEAMREDPWCGRGAPTD